MRKLLPLTLLAVAGFLSSCGGGAGDGIMSALFGEGARLRPMQTCTTTVNSVGALQQALTQAQSNNQDDVICIQAGTYQVTQTLTYITPNGDGGHKLTIKAVGGTVTLNGNNSVQIMRIDTDSDNSASTSDAQADVTIEGITFQNGNNSSGDGGGLYVKTREANITLTNNTFSGNQAQYGGGAYAGSGSGTVTLTNNTFSNNTAQYDGGGAYARSYSGTVTLTNNTFSGNQAQNGGGAYAYSGSGNINLTNNTFSGNQARYGGGAFARSGLGN
ncbi:MAG: right-handed parallel beta-helix repeat-containing protein, partial [Aquificaceae bacterium]|nr:right-handed parallel beta-helix repeat-containing protein [Aquificaceae bacterium]